MDYEKMYKAVLKTATQWIKDGCSDKEKICLESIFPQLRESEDEKIRKLLVWQVYRNIEDETNDLAGSVYDGIKGHDPDLEESIEDWKKCLAWLEKQKEPENTSASTMIPSCWTEKQKEQKPIKWKPQPESLEALMYAIEGKWDCIKPTSYLSRRLEDLYEGLVNTFNVDESLLTELPKVASRANTAEGIEELRELKHKIEASMEQKPAEWSEEDKAIIGCIVCCLDGQFVTEAARKQCLEWFNKHRRDFLNQPKQEWSEEDEEMLNSCISSIEEAKENRYAYKETDGDTSYDHEIAWLKSLRPQPQWKPSEAQLMALHSVIDDESDTIGNEQLKSLYNDLKKL